MTSRVRSQDVQRLYEQKSDFIQVSLIESQEILGAFDKRLKKYAEKKMRKRKNFQLIKSSVIGARHNNITNRAIHYLA